jgi:hypothetical protein
LKVLSRCRADKAFRYRTEKWFWLCQIPFVTVIVLVSPDTWEVISLPYVAVLSVYALVLSAAGAEQAAEAVSAASEQEESQNDDEPDTIPPPK